MFRVACLCVLICGLVFASASNGDNGAPNAGNTIPVDEWTEEKVEAILSAKAAAAEKGKSHAEVKAEVGYLSNLYNKHFREGNCGDIINMYDPNIMLTEHDGPVMKGFEAIQYTFAEMQGVASMNISSLSVTPLGKQGRLVFQHAHTTCHDREGNFMFSGESFEVWKRHSSGLKLYLEIYDLEAVTEV